MKMSRFVALFIVVLLTVAFTPLFASGGQEKSDEIVLTWPTHWVGEDGKGPIVETLVTEFNAMHEGEIRVVLEEHPEADAAENVIRTRIAAGSPPDIFLFKLGPTTRPYYDSNMLLDLTDELEKDGWGDNFSAGAMGVSTIEGRVKSLPVENALTPIWYNERLFLEAGINEFPRTIEDFWVAADRLKANGIIPTSQMTGGANAWTSMLWFTHLVGSIGGPDVWDRAWDDPAFEQAAAIMKRLYSDGNTTRDAIGAGAGESSAHYMNERTAVFINGPWFVTNIRTNAPEVHAVTKLTYAPSAGDYYGHQVGWLLTSMAAARSDDPARNEAAIEFLRFFTDPTNAKRMSLEVGSLIPIKFDIGPGDAVDPLQRQFIQLSNDAEFLVDGIEAVMPVRVVQEFGQALSSMVLNDLQPREFVEMMKAAGE
jgi:raffinose/stachyose/melibiose transport system substrate-binding protein